MANSNSFVHYVSYKKNQREMDLYLYIESKSCKSAWIKEAEFEKMEREQKASKEVTSQNNQFSGIPNNIPVFNPNFN